LVIIQKIIDWPEGFIKKLMSILLWMKIYEKND
jgi:hypothetical protein